MECVMCNQQGDGMTECMFAGKEKIVRLCDKCFEDRFCQKNCSHCVDSCECIGLYDRCRIAELEFAERAKRDYDDLFWEKKQLSDELNAFCYTQEEYDKAIAAVNEKQLKINHALAAMGFDPIN